MHFMFIAVENFFKILQADMEHKKQFQTFFIVFIVIKIAGFQDII